MIVYYYYFAIPARPHQGKQDSHDKILHLQPNRLPQISILDL